MIAKTELLAQAAHVALLVCAAGSAIAVTLRSLGRRRRGPETQDQRPAREGIADLARMIEAAASRPISRERIASRLRSVCLGALALRNGGDVDRARSLLRSGEWTESPELRAILAEDYMEAWERKGMVDKGFLPRLEAAIAALERFQGKSQGG